MLRLSMIGFGAIGQAVFNYLQQQANVKIEAIIVPKHAADKVAQVLSGHSGVQLQSDLSNLKPDLIVECAGHAALQEHVLPALRRGIPAIVVSIGALAEQGMAQALEDAAREGKTSVQLVSGAIGAIDALAAAKLAGLDSVEYIGKKPALAWLGTPAEQMVDLHQLSQATDFYIGNAREAAQQYPKNANVAATLALAGLGFERTSVRLVADPQSHENIHTVVASGAFGRFELTMQGKPLASNPKTSALTVFSVIRAVMNHVQPVCI